jgi:hypothetical protein
VVNCKGPCDQATVIDALRTRGLWPQIEEAHRDGQAGPTDEWPIRDVDGHVVAIHQRWDESPKRKHFAWRRPGCAAPGLYGLRAADLPLYGTEDLASWPDGDTVLLVEGEKSRDALTALGRPAVATVTGAKTTPSDEALRPLLRFDVVLWADNDPDGRAHMERIAGRLVTLGARPRWLEWPDAPPRGDAADFRALGGTAEQLGALVAGAPQMLSAATSTIGAAESIFRTARQLAEDTPEEVDWIAEALGVGLGTVTELDGKPKSAGKTTLALHLVRCVRHGAEFLGQPTRRSAVVYLTEQTGTSFRTALRRADLLDADDLHCLTWAQVRGRPWGEVVQLAVSYAHQVGAELLIVDTLGRFAGLAGDAENTSGAAMEAMGWLQAAAADGLAVVVCRHERKAGGDVGDSGRGSNQFTGDVDTVFALRRAQGDGRPTVRVLHGLSRFEHIPETQVIDWTPAGYIVLGDQTAYAAAEAGRAVLDSLPTTAVLAWTQDTLQERTGLRRTVMQAALKTLIAADEVRREGQGKKGDPFTYWRPPTEAGPPAPEIHAAALRIDVSAESIANGAVAGAVQAAATGGLAAESNPGGNGPTLPVAGDAPGDAGREVFEL